MNQSDRKRIKLKLRSDEIANLKARVNELERECKLMMETESLRQKQDNEHYKALRDLRYVLFEWRVKSKRRFSIIDGFEGLVKTLFVMISPKTAEGKEIAPYHVLQAMRVMIEQTRGLGYAEYPKIGDSEKHLVFQDEIPPCLRLDSTVGLCDRMPAHLGDYHKCRDSGWALATMSALVDKVTEAIEEKQGG